jgi:fructose-1-phosphate kinase PfkB-like protein
MNFCLENVLFVGLSPSMQKTIIFDSLKIGDVNRSVKYYLDASGKCVNAARVFIQLGGSAVCLTQVGGTNGKKFINLASESGVNIKAVWTDVDVRYCYTLLDSQSATELVVNEPEPIDKSINDTFIKMFSESLDSVSNIVVSGSRTTGFSDDIIPNMVKKAKGRGIKVFADYRGADLKNSFLSRDVRPDYIKINMSDTNSTN